MRFRLIAAVMAVCALSGISCEESDVVAAASYLEGLRGKPEITVVLVGDDIAGGGWSTTAVTLGRRLKPRLAELLGTRVSMIETGNAEETFDHARRRLQEDVLFYRPDVVLVMLGTNDLSQPDLQPVVFRDITAGFFGMLKKREVFAVAVTMPGFRDVLSGKEVYDRIKSFNDTIALQARLNHYPVIDLAERMAEYRDKDFAAAAALYYDTARLNDSGQEFVAGFICDSIRSIMERGNRRK